MPLTIDIIYPRRTRDWDPSQHPRGQPENKGEFTAKGSALPRSPYATPARSNQNVARHAAAKVVAPVTHFAHHFGHEDAKILGEHLHSVKAPERKAVGNRLRLMAKATPHLLNSHVQQERKHAVNAARALRSMATGVKPTPDEMKGLYSFGARALMTSAAVVAGDPSGTLIHIAASFSQEAVQHVVIEHALELLVGAGRVIHRIMRGASHDDASYTGFDETLLQRFLQAMADSVETITPEDTDRILGAGTQDAFKETDHPRGQPENAGEFAPKEGGAEHEVREAAKRAAPTRAHLVPSANPGPAGEGGKRVSVKGGKMPEHIQSLRIPPAWTDLQYSPDAKASTWVIGKDAKGKNQYILNPAYARSNAEAKFRRIKELDRKFDTVRRQNDKNRLSKDQKIRDLADCAHVIMQTGIRPGSEADTGAAVQAYGATTLLGKHVVPTADGVSLQFVGKKGVALNIPVHDPDTAKMLKTRAEAAGAEGKVFGGVDDGALRRYVHTFDGGGFKTKDMRTLLGTRTAIEHIKALPTPTDAKSYKKAVKEVATQVSQKLGNTPAVALQAYISPVVFSQWKMSAGV